MIAAQVPEGIVQIVEFNLHFGNAWAVCNAVSAHTFDPFFLRGISTCKTRQRERRTDTTVAEF